MGCAIKHIIGQNEPSQVIPWNQETGIFQWNLPSVEMEEGMLGLGSSRLSLS